MFIEIRETRSKKTDTVNYVMYLRNSKWIPGADGQKGKVQNISIYLGSGIAEAKERLESVVEPDSAILAAFPEYAEKFALKKAAIALQQLVTDLTGSTLADPVQKLLDRVNKKQEKRDEKEQKNTEPTSQLREDYRSQIGKKRKSGENDEQPRDKSDEEILEEKGQVGLFESDDKPDEKKDNQSQEKGDNQSDVGVPKCPRCGAFLETKKGRDGDYTSCSKCDYKEFQ